MFKLIQRLAQTVATRIMQRGMRKAASKGMF
jgi:hypothetical protein